MNVLVFDIGNTRIKAGLFNSGVLSETYNFSSKDEPEFINYISQNNQIPSVAASVGNPETLAYLKSNISNFIIINGSSQKVMVSHYATQETLGIDRLAAAAAAKHLVSSAWVLIVDAGTCLTTDLINKSGEYLGGRISPGIQMRLDAMYDYTHALPKLTTELTDNDLIGDSTKNSMMSGAVNGVWLEVLALAEELNKKYPEIEIVTTGGNGSFLDKRFKSGKFATRCRFEPNLVLIGLYQMYINK